MRRCSDKFLGQGGNAKDGIAVAFTTRRLYLSISGQAGKMLVHTLGHTLKKHLLYSIC